MQRALRVFSHRLAEPGYHFIHKHHQLACFKRVVRAKSRVLLELAGLRSAPMRS
jgi:predicted component of type VI protein secretion system